MVDVISLYVIRDNMENVNLNEQKKREYNYIFSLLLFSFSLLHDPVISVIIIIYHRFIVSFPIELDFLFVTLFLQDITMLCCIPYLLYIYDFQ